MIAPDMATMLVYIFTDAQMDPDAALQDLVSTHMQQHDVQLYHRGQRYLDLGQFDRGRDWRQSA